MHSEQLYIIEKWFEGFNTKNLELLLSLFHDDAEHFSPKLKIRQPETNGLIRGKNQLRVWWQDAFDRLPELNYHLNYSIIDHHAVFVEYKRTVPGEEDMTVGEVLFIENGKIVRSKVFHS
ncbi:MAG: nuclear transport factor 2 family protein [Bacteroidia bacterium]